MHTKGTSCSDATPATSACDPSPPAMPMTSAPRATASRASVSRSSPASSMTVSMPLACAAAANSGLAFPPPECGFMISTGRRAAPTGTPGGGASTGAPHGWRAWRRARSPRWPARARSPSTMSSRVWFRRRVTKPMTMAATAMSEARSRTTPRRVMTYHAAAVATTIATSAPSSANQLFQSTTTATTTDASAHSSAAIAQSRRPALCMAAVSSRPQPVGRPASGRGRCRGHPRGGDRRGVRSR